MSLKLETTEEITFWKQAYIAYAGGAREWMVDTGETSVEDLADAAVRTLRSRKPEQDKGGDRL